MPAKLTGIMPGLQMQAVIVLAERAGDTWTVTNCDRLPPHTPYAEQAAHLAGQLQADATPRLLHLNITGAGEALMALFRAALPHGGGLRAMKLVEDESCDWSAHPLTVGKPFLLTTLVVLVQTGRLVLPEHEGGQALYQALSTLRPGPEHFASVEQETLLLALGLAVLESPNSAERHIEALQARLALQQQRPSTPIPVPWWRRS